MRGDNEALIATRLILLYDTDDSTNDVKAGHLAAIQSEHLLQLGARKYWRMCLKK